MKTTTKLALLIITLCSSLLSCKEKEDENDLCDRASFYGTWAVDYNYKYIRNDSVLSDISREIEMTFSAADTMVYEVYEGNPLKAKWYVQPNPARMVLEIIYPPASPEFGPNLNFYLLDIVECGDDTRVMEHSARDGGGSVAWNVDTYRMRRK